MHIIGYHTCSREGLKEEIEKNGPFFSRHEPNDPSKHKFLGSGYYFWDNNRGMAHSYGKSTYRRSYYIFEAEIRLNQDNFFDLVGNRNHMIALEKLMETIGANHEESDRWTIGSFIEFLKRIGLFDYRAIRAIDSSIRQEVHDFKFASQHPPFTNLSPVYIVCLLDTNKDILTSFRFSTECPLPK